MPGLFLLSLKNGLYLFAQITKTIKIKVKVRHILQVLVRNVVEYKYLYKSVAILPVKNVQQNN